MTEDWGREKHQGGPRKWEAHAVRLENEPRCLSWLVFPNPSFHPIPLTTFVPNASVSNDDVPGDHHNNNDMNPTWGLGAVRRGEPSHRMATARTMAATTTAAATTIMAATTTVAAVTAATAATTAAATAEAEAATTAAEAATTAAEAATTAAEAATAAAAAGATTTHQQ